MIWHFHLRRKPSILYFSTHCICHFNQSDSISSYECQQRLHHVSMSTSKLKTASLLTKMRWLHFESHGNRFMLGQSLAQNPSGYMVVSETFLPVQQLTYKEIDFQLYSIC